LSNKYIDDLSFEFIDSVLGYDPNTGELRWKVRRNKMKAGSLAGSVTVWGYRQLRINGKMYRAARLIWLLMTGAWPKYEVDHRDLNGLNDQWDNLRQATPTQNMYNRKVRSDNIVGFKGVRKYNHNGRCYEARITVNKKRIILGYYNDPKDAALRYELAALELHGEYARTT
jgi:hypothetical protein